LNFMMISPFRAALSCMLAILLPLSTLSAQNPPAGAILSAKGIVTVNGAFVKDSSAVGDSDTISTGPESIAHITSPGSNTLLASESIAAYSHDSIRLTAGAVSIATNGGMYTQVHKLKFSPADQGALTKYEVRIAGCEVTVIARAGRVSLPDGQILAQGESHQSSDSDCVSSAKLPPITGAPIGAVSGVGYVTIGTIAAIGGSAVAVALLESGGKTPVSPARP
jgi:hypothetical protein